MKNKYKILVLSDLDKSTSKTIKSSVSIANILHADINFFYVKKPTDVVEKESQLSAMRTINKEYLTIDKKIKDFIIPISSDYNVKINHTFTIGNVKNEIAKHIDDTKPDIIVLGKRKSKLLSFMGDNITQFVLNKHKGTIVISDDKNSLEPNRELSLGLFNCIDTQDVLYENIIRSTHKPIKSFKISENSSNLKEENILNDKKTVEYVFEKGDNAIKNISSYLTKNKINLLFVNRKKEGSISSSNMKNVMNNLNCSLILTS